MKPSGLVSLSLAFLFTTSLAVAQDKAAKPVKVEPAAKAPPATSTATSTAGATPMGPPKPAPELDATYKALDGSWKCDTTFAANAMGPGSPEIKVKTNIKFKKDLNGFWYRGDYEAKKTKDFPGMKGTVYLGHDGKQLLTSLVDSMGGYSAGTGTASGDTLTFIEDGYMMGMKTKMRDTIQKKSDKEISHRFEVDMGKGFKPMGEDLCKR
jgi:hypothetical protein